MHGDVAAGGQRFADEGVCFLAGGSSPVSASRSTAARPPRSPPAAGWNPPRATRRPPPRRSRSASTTRAGGGTTVMTVRGSAESVEARLAAYNAETILARALNGHYARWRNRRRPCRTGLGDCLDPDGVGDQLGLGVEPDHAQSSPASIALVITALLPGTGWGSASSLRWRQRPQHDGADDRPLIEAAASQHMTHHAQPDQPQRRLTVKARVPRLRRLPAARRDVGQRRPPGTLS